MAQNQFINVTADANAAKKIDIADHRHVATNAASTAGDMTLSWDSAKFTSINALRGAMNAIIQKAMGQMS